MNYTGFVIVAYNEKGFVEVIDTLFDTVEQAEEVIANELSFIYTDDTTFFVQGVY